MSTVGQVAKIACRLSRRRPEDEDDFSMACDHVVDAQRFICGRADPWDFLQGSGQMKTVIGADLYPFQELAATFEVGGVKRVLGIVDDTEARRPLQPCHWTVLERVAGSSQLGAGAPVMWAPIGVEKIRLFPTPNQVVTLGVFFEQKVGDAESSTEMVIPESFASPVCATWAAARMWEQHAGVESRMMADRMDRRHDQAVHEMVAAHGVVRWPYFTLMEQEALAHPQAVIYS